MTMITLAILAFVALFFMNSYNRLLVSRNRIRNAWLQIDGQLRRRYDLIPNLVKTVRGYAAHERGTLEMVMKARAQMAGANTVGEHAEAQNAISDALETLFAVAEAYPELKASQSFLMLREELSGTESKIAFARQFYNDTVMNYNSAIQGFPRNLVARVFGFTVEDLFEVAGAARERVRMNALCTTHPPKGGE